MAYLELSLQKVALGTHGALTVQNFGSILGLRRLQGNEPGEFDSRHNCTLSAVYSLRGSLMLLTFDL